MNSPQPPTVVAGARISDVVSPVSLIKYREPITSPLGTVPGGWQHAPLIQELDVVFLSYRTREELDRKMQPALEPISAIKDDLPVLTVLLPIAIRDVVNEYSFVFRVNIQELWSEPLPPSVPATE